jgi:integrase
MLIQIFDAAESNELVTRNPARLAKSIRFEEAASSKKDSFTEPEVSQLMKYLPCNLLGHSIRLMLGSGIRAQELLALTPDDIDDDGTVIHISKAVKMVDGKPVLGVTKSKRSNRDIPIPQTYRGSALYLKENGGKAFIWCSGHGSMLYGVGTFRKWYYHELERVPEVRRLSPHCCRHTYISRLQAKGVPMVEIARLVGHTNITTTDGYLHMNSETLAQAVSALDTMDNVPERG